MLHSSFTELDLNHPWDRRLKSNPELWKEDSYAYTNLQSCQFSIEEKLLEGKWLKSIGLIETPIKRCIPIMIDDTANKLKAKELKEDTEYDLSETFIKGKYHELAQRLERFTNLEQDKRTKQSCKEILNTLATIKWLETLKPGLLQEYVQEVHAFQDYTLHTYNEDEFT